MNVGDKATVIVTGKIVKKELYKDNKVRVMVQNNDTEEVGIVIDSEENYVT